MTHQLKIALKQGIGVPPQAVVRAGEHVRRGQVIARCDETTLGVDLHSPANGIVTSAADGYIVIEAAPDQTEFDYVRLEPGLSVADTVRRAGIIGLGGAGFPSYVKLGTRLDPSGYVLCNAAECEPVLEHNMHQIRQDPEGLLRAVAIAMEATGAGKGIIGMKLKHRTEIKLLTSAIKAQGIQNIRVLPLRNVYPVGEERALIRDTLNQLLETTQLPSAANAVVFNVETLYAIRDAVDEGKPLMDKYLTVAGRLKDLDPGETIVLRVPLGQSVAELLEAFGGFVGETGEILLGGPYTGRRGSSEDTVGKTLGGILVTQPFEQLEAFRVGIIQCACGPLYPRLEQVARSMGGEIVGHEVCKNAVESRGTYKCMNPGNCPGQAEKVLALKKLGAQTILIGHCSDCTNTVMGSAPKLGLEVRHITDHVLLTMGQPVLRTFDETQL